MRRRGRRALPATGPASLIAPGALGIAAAGAARAAYTVLGSRPPGGREPWSRTNHRGEPVTLLQGPAVAAGAVAATLAPGSARLSARGRAALAIAGAGAGAFGIYDDLAGSSARRGLRGHLGALAHGEVTTGAVKLGGIGATGLASAAALGGEPADVAVNAALIAGGANLLNLFDLRPGRAIKVAIGSGALITVGGAAAGNVNAAAASVAAPAGAALALLGEDLAERAMLGDGGANALGAMLGAAAAASLPRPARIALLAGITALTVTSEFVSFTKVIERTPALRKIDMLGRRPAAPVPPKPVPVQRSHPEPGGGASARSGEDKDVAPPER